MERPRLDAWSRRGAYAVTGVDKRALTARSGKGMPNAVDRARARGRFDTAALKREDALSRNGGLDRAKR